MVYQKANHGCPERGSEAKLPAKGSRFRADERHCWMTGADLPKSCPGATMSQLIVMTASGYEAGWGEVGREFKHSTSKACMLSSAHILHSVLFQTRTWQHGQVNELNVCPSILARMILLRVNPYRGQLPNSNWNSVYFQRDISFTPARPHCIACASE